MKDPGNGPDLTEAWWEWCLALLQTGPTEALWKANIALAELQQCSTDVVERMFWERQQTNGQKSDPQPTSIGSLD